MSSLGLLESALILLESNSGLLESALGLLVSEPTLLESNSGLLEPALALLESNSTLLVSASALLEPNLWLSRKSLNQVNQGSDNGLGKSVNEQTHRPCEHSKHLL